MTDVRVQRVVLRAADARAAERLARNLPQTLRRSLETGELRGRRDVERTLREAAQEARR